MSIELFSDKDLIDPYILRVVKDMKKAGWTEIETLELLLINRLKVTGQSEYIPTLKKQIELIKKTGGF